MICILHDDFQSQTKPPTYASVDHEICTRTRDQPGLSQPLELMEKWLSRHIPTAKNATEFPACASQEFSAETAKQRRERQVLAFVGHVLEEETQYEDIASSQ